MSFLSGGAECSTAANPLSQFSKHVQDDKSLQRDRLVGRGPAGGLQEGMRGNMRMRGDGDGMMDEFMQAPAGAAPILQHGPPGHMDPMMMHRFGPMRNGSPAAQQAHWASEFDTSGGSGGASQQEMAQQKQPGGHFQPADFQNFMRMKNGPSAAAAVRPGSAENLQHRPMGYSGMGYSDMAFGGMGGMGMYSGYTPAFSQQFQHQQHQQQQQPVTDNGKGKGRMVELDDKDWEAQFAQLDIDEKTAATADQQKAETDLDEQAQRDMERELDALDSDKPAERGEGKESILPPGPLDDPGLFASWDEDFSRVWDDSLRAVRRMNEAAREAQRSSVESTNKDLLANSEDVLGDREHEPGEDEDWYDMYSNSVNTHLRSPEFGDYLFERENLFSQVGNPFEEGVKIMDEAGNLSLAALAFEAAVQRDPSHVEAWVRLGAAQAQNEKESPAIRALEQALKLDPNNLEALMGLAVSYTNEGYDSTAYRTLERWLSVRYPAIAPPPSTGADTSPINEIGFTDRALLHERVTELFIQAAQLSPSPEAMDPDVQVGLGVLFYGAEEFSKAVDCFSAALGSSESGVTTSARANQRPLLWNRLGATLANSGRSEEAIDAYGEALQLNPSFVRARYNLGVSCINIGCYNEAAQHLLGALAMHKVVEKEGREKARELLSAGGDAAAAPTDAQLEQIFQQNQSTNLYDTLRRVFGQMGRKDLADKVVSGVDVDIFRSEFDF